MIDVYLGTFVKKDGSERTMKFVKFKDLPREFLSNKIKGTGKSNLKEGFEVVYDIDQRDFRVFNHNAVIGDLLKLQRETKLAL